MARTIHELTDDENGLVECSCGSKHIIFGANQTTPCLKCGAVIYTDKKGRVETESTEPKPSYQNKIKAIKREGTISNTEFEKKYKCTPNKL